MQNKIILAIVIPFIFIISILLFYNETIDWSNTTIGKLFTICIILFYAEINLTYGFLALMFVVFYYRICFPIETEPEENKKILSKTDGKIPLVIYQTWKTKHLPPKMKACVENLKKDNPEFEHYLFDDYDCRAFIKENFEDDVLHAYDALVPGAYKADLWRYCVLYKKGGIYLDIKFKCNPGFNLLEFMNEDEVFVLDRPTDQPFMTPDQYINFVNSDDLYDSLNSISNPRHWKNKQIGIYNAVMATKPNNPIMMKCIKQIIKNVKSKYYGFGALYPTGPGLLSEIYFGNKYKEKIKKFKYFNSIAGNYIVSKKRVILTQYPEYRTEQNSINITTKKSTYYTNMWFNKDIYTSNK